MSKRIEKGSFYEEVLVCGLMVKITKELFKTDKEYVINEKDLNAVFPNVAEEDKERIIRIVAKKIRAGFDPINVTFLVSTKAKTNKDGTFSRKTCKLTIWAKETKE